MDNDIDIYADLPSINLNTEQNDQLCNCKESEKKLSSLTNELENLQKIKNTLENNLSSLLKTAKAEIARKDRMIDSLKKRLDDISFRRNRKYESQGFSTYTTSDQQYDVMKQYENVSTMQEIESRLYQTEFCQDESESKKIQSDTDQTPTIFGERMHKRILETEEEKQKVLRFNGGKETAEESNKENGSRFSVNNNRNESSITRNSGTEPPYTKNSEKRAIEEDSARGNKRLKLEDNKDETASEALYQNHVTQYDLKDNLAQYEVKDNFVKSNDRLDVAHSFKKEHAPFNVMHRTASEDTKQSRSSNEWKREERSDYSRKDYDGSRSRKGSIDNWRSYRNTLTSNHVSEGFNDEYKNGYRYSLPRTHSKSPSRRYSKSPSRKHSKSPSRRYSKSPSRKHSKSPSRRYSKSPSRKYSKGRSDHESSSSHRLRERSNRTYRDRKYDAYEYNDRYRNGRLKKDYDSKEYDNNKSRYGNREHGDLRDRYKHSLSDVEDNFYKNKKYKNRRIKESTPNVSDNKKPCENDKTVAAIDTRASFSRNADVDQNIEHKTENEPNVKIANSSENTVTRAEMDLNNLEEGQLLDSPEKKTNSASILRNNKIANNNASCRTIENKIKDDSASAFVDDKTNTIISTKQKVDVKVNKAGGTRCLPQANPEDNRKVMQTKSSSASDAMSDEKNNSNNDDDVCRLRSNKVSTDDIRDAATIQQMRDNNDDSCKTHGDKKLKSSTESPTKIKDTDNSSREEDNKVENLSKSDIESIESTLKKKEINDLDTESAIKSAELNHINDDNNRNTENEKLENSPVAELTTKVEIEINCDTKNKDETEIQNKNEICNAVSDKSDIEMSRLCLSDHNYVRNVPAVEPATDSDAVQEPSVMSDCKTAGKTITLRKTKTKEVVDVQSISTSKTTSPIVKSKKNQQAQGIIISRRRRAVTLSDSKASMTVLMNRNVAKTPAVNPSNYNDYDDPASKPRLRPASSRSSSKTICK
ncbi:hypothetical protein DMN91_008734 [Ooceraea biroi]|uniref:Uncharacterized protein n=1 Tax=Ooceraea biroi TaxID=2015173 RepID=A0A3L8DD30_OOCBI|nr:uncharacterized protein DDB_G0287625 [Ooceraea biroi]RLU18377.1 hypothetical protein DMN91_008734 [Ooceraea biroi]